MKRLIKYFDLMPSELYSLEISLINEMITSPINKTENLYSRETDFDYEFSWNYLDNIMLDDLIAEGIVQDDLRECSKEETYSRLLQLNFSVLGERQDRCNCFTRLAMNDEVIRLKPTRIFTNLLFSLHHNFNRLEIYTLLNLNEQQQSLYRLIKTSKERCFKIDYVIRLLGLEKQIFFDDLRRNQNSMQQGLEHYVSSLKATEKQQAVILGLSGQSAVSLQKINLELDVNKECVFIQDKDKPE